MAEDPAGENRFWCRRRKRLQKLRGDLTWKSFVCQTKQMIIKIINPSLSVAFFVNPVRHSFFLLFFCWKLKRFFSFFVLSCANPVSHSSPFSSFSFFECLKFLFCVMGVVCLQWWRVELWWVWFCSECWFFALCKPNVPLFTLLNFLVFFFG